MNRRNFIAGLIAAFAAPFMAKTVPEIESANSGIPYRGPVDLEAWRFYGPSPDEVWYMSYASDPTRWDVEETVIGGNA